MKRAEVPPVRRVAGIVASSDPRHPGEITALDGIYRGIVALLPLPLGTTFIPTIQTLFLTIQTFILIVQTLFSAIQTFISAIQTFILAIQTLFLGFQTFVLPIQTLFLTVQTFILAIQTFFLARFMRFQ